MTEVIADAAYGEIMYRDNIGTPSGEWRVETVNFPPFPGVGSETRAWDYDYCGFETLVTKPDGTQYGNGPENANETASQCHLGAVQAILAKEVYAGPDDDQKLNWRPL